MTAEVVVAGGGPAGAAAALVLARLGRRVLLAGGIEADAFRVGEAVPPAVNPLLRDLGVLDRFLATAPLPCFGNVSVWGGDVPTVNDFIFDPNGHGWHIDRVQFDQMLRVAARDHGADVFKDMRLTGAIRDGTCWQVTLTTAERQAVEIRCNWLIDATGRRAAVARRVGVRNQRDDRLVAFYARFRSTRGTDSDSRTVIESDPDGWWYTALVPSGERVVALLTDADLIDHAEILTQAGFAQRLGASRFIRGVLNSHQYEAVSPPRGADAGTARLVQVTGDGWVAVGDAAIAFDPLSSQGILTSLFTGLRAGQAIDSILAGDSIGLHVYARRVDEIDRAYRHHRAAYYALESRWRDRLFWRRRLNVL